MRRSELLSLPPRQINVELRYLQINDTKGNENRKIILNDTAIECISGLFDEESDFIFYSKYNHKPLRSIRKPWAKAKEKAEIYPDFLVFTICVYIYFTFDNERRGSLYNCSPGRSQGFKNDGESLWTLIIRTAPRWCKR